jgi:hypothetical protein
VGIRMDGMGVGILGILMDVKVDTTGVPQIEGPIEKCMDSVGPIELRDGNMDIPGRPPRGFPPVPLDVGLDGSATLDEIFSPKIVGGLLNMKKCSLKISLAWISRGVCGSIKGGLKFGGGCSSTTCTLEKLVLSNQS